ncbi:ScbA/BarX family gamma-butyrolactone biosynthesis protein [Streptomyces sp. WMMB 322]|uniref:ScbA/BarX family gamma-butyrolactone biosynthesis protein n=1 Tax=Streptomyces sp. WMMB 322 TaxID=1286821 RepID=UPI0006E32E1F|nr:ScbA/BarX family gamma-butyrolactone biosynthesis protein [Streptomyces sp. WMMB 322]SCK57007.1 A-factor biosynthesis hotdog domain-containing protein [Streptomyces sp. WMMB 322]
MAHTPAVPDLPESTAYSWPVPREFVHKTAHSEVLLTGWRRCGQREFEVGAQWPRDHGFWRTDDDGVQDPMLLVETTRQVLPLIAHAAYGVPPGHQLIWDHHHCTFSTPFLPVTGAPAEVVLHLSAAEAPVRGKRPRRITLSMTVRSAGRVIGSASTVYTAHSPQIYGRLRGPGTPSPPDAMAAALAPPPALTPSLVGRESEREVVLAPAGVGSGGRRQLRVLTTSPWLFDHPVDHAPGMLLMEAARQSAHLAAAPHRPGLTRMEAEFHRYVDLDAPSWVEVSPGPDEAGDEDRPARERTLTVSVTQHGKEAFTGLVGFRTEAGNAARPPALG